MAAESTTVPPRRGCLGRASKIVLIVFVALLIAGMTGWCSLFLLCSPLPGDTFRKALALIFAFGVLLAFIIFKKRWRTVLGFFIVFAAIVTWYYLIPPSNDRNWAPEVAQMPTATINGDLVTMTNIRNFEYRTVTDFTPRYYDKTYDLSKLESVDFSSITWGMNAIAHVIVSFGFGDGVFVAFSIEMRNMKGQENSMTKSFFRNYELIYIVADERDVIRVRTNYRNPREQVEMYRTRIPLENQRKLFLSYVKKIDSLSKRPEWYNTLEDNCTTGVVQRVQSYGGKVHYSWKILLSGYMAEELYEKGGIDTSMPFAELKKISLINAKAEAADKDPDFSVKIRARLPMPKPYTMQELQSMP